MLAGLFDARRASPFIDHHVRNIFCATVFMSPFQGYEAWWGRDPGASLRFAPGYFMSRFQREE
jgi:hypothetical protein